MSKNNTETPIAADDEVSRVRLRYEDGDIVLCEDLDDLVHSLAAASASAINNQGLRAQVEYIFEQLGHEQAVAALQRISGPAGL